MKIDGSDEQYDHENSEKPVLYQDLVGGLEHVLFFDILGLIIPSDFHIFQRG